VLHRRAYRESSFLLEIFTQEYGRLSLIAKGVRQRHASLSGLLQPFVPLLVSFTGKGELMALSHAEMSAPIVSLQKENLFAGFYLNELLICLLQKWDAHPSLYQRYEKTLGELRGEKLDQKILRSFEKNLLHELGYGILPITEIDLHAKFDPLRYYRFMPEQGFVESELAHSGGVQGNLFLGKNLLAIAREDWQDEESLADARRLMRLVLTPLMGRPIHSRRLFG
jgi:DNA repair protein RecO (recombination protein O)